MVIIVWRGMSTYQEQCIKNGDSFSCNLFCGTQVLGGVGYVLKRPIRLNIAFVYLSLYCGRMQL